MNFYFLLIFLVEYRAGLYASGRPMEDADSRTIFVNNVIAPFLLFKV